MANNSESESIKRILINTIQAIEKQVGFKKVDSEEIITNMALVYLFKVFDVGFCLDHDEVIDERSRLLEDLEGVKKAIEEGVDINANNRC